MLISRASSQKHRRLKSSKNRDVSSYMDSKSKKAMSEGVDHKSPTVPSGSVLTTLPVSNTGSNLAVYWSDSPNNHSVEHVFIMVHGKLRNGGEYWKIMNDALDSAVKDNYGGATSKSIVVAPQFYSLKLNKGQYDQDTLAWDDINAWQAGSVAIHPKGTSVSSVDAMDAIVAEFTNANKYPNLKNLTLVGHGGGGQLMNRYATVGADPKSNKVYVRYIVGDPSSSAYFTKHRPVTDKSVADISKCDAYDDWRYGFSQFPGTLSSNMKPQDYYAQYVRRDVVNIVGYQDTAKNGDQKCMALLQGGQKRRDRNLSWWRYINMLGGTNENLDGFPGNFSGLPDWSSSSNGVIKTRLCVVEDATHDAAKVFGGKEGRSALFDHYNVEMGWRPDGWSFQAPKQKNASNSSSSASSKQSTAPTTSSSSSTSKQSAVPQLSVRNASSKGYVPSVAAVLFSTLLAIAFM